MTSRKHGSRPNIRALTAETGTRAGHGQDNLVHNLSLPSYAEGLISEGEWVVKVSHQGKGAEHKRDWDQDSTQAAISGTLYKKNKYDILKHFLGRFVPDSLFLASTVDDNGLRRPAEVTLQKRVPDITLNKLTEAQKDDPRLHANILELLQKLQYMYSVIGEVNSRTAQGVNLDTKLDLGQVSSFVREQDIDYQFGADDAQIAAHKIKSPNLLVDPETMSLYCIDFDQGDWTPGMDEAKDLVFAIDERRLHRATTAAHLALQGHVERPL